MLLGEVGGNDFSWCAANKHKKYSAKRGRF
jgi:hypothetical protein